MKDIKENNNNDISISNSSTNEVSFVETIYQIIKTIVSTPPKDAEILPFTSFSPDDFLGRKITDSLKDELRGTIISTIVSSTSLFEFQFNVDVIELDDITLGIIIKINETNDKSSLRLIFDTVSGGVIAYLVRPKKIG